MRAIICTTILILICILACGCTGKTPAVPVPVTPMEELGLTKLSDSHPNTTFSHDPGVIVVSFWTDGAQKMELDFSNVSQGYVAATQFTTSGPYAGSVAFQAPVKDTYQLNISGSGRWTAEVTPLVTTNPLKAPVNLSGSGTVVTPVFSLEKGEYFFSRNETGLASPYYFLYYVNGTPLMDANNSYIQPGFGERSSHPFVFVTVPESGTFYLSVLGRNNPGNWSVSLSLVPKLPPMGPGPEIYTPLKSDGNP
ncbi:MAG: hypothetical protein M0Q92_11880 [Methanoregula sp.]|nr:hypothetical protein [Methanoregula sp.]